MGSMATIKEEEIDALSPKQYGRRKVKAADIQELNTRLFNELISSDKHLHIPHIKLQSSSSQYRIFEPMKSQQNQGTNHMHFHHPTKNGTFSKNIFWTL